MPSILVDQLLAIPTLEKQKQFLALHVAELNDEFATLLRERADEFLRSGVTRAFDLAQLFFQMASLTGNELYRALGLLRQANAYAAGGLGNYEEAIALCDAAATIYRAQGQNILAADTQITKIYALSMLGRSDEALAAGQWAAGVFEQHSEWMRLGNLSINVAIVYSRLGDEQKALTLYQRATQLFAEFVQDGQWYTPGIELNRSISLRNLGQFEASIQAGRAAYEQLNQLGMEAEAARALQEGVAFTYFLLGRYNEALQLLDQALTIFQKYERHFDALQVELYVCECLLQLRRFGDVLEKSQAIRLLCIQAGSKFEEGYTLLNMALAHVGFSHYPQALQVMQEARQLFSADGNHVWSAMVDLEMTTILFKQDALAPCLTLANQCIQTFTAFQLPVQQAKALLIVGQAAYAMQQYETARTQANEVLKISSSKNIPSLNYQAYRLLGMVAESCREIERALHYYEQAIETVEQLRGRLMIEFRSDFLEDKQIVYEEMVALCCTVGRTAQGLAYAERAKSRALLELLAYRLDLSIQTRAEEDRPLVDEITHLRAIRDQLYRRWEGNMDFKGRGWSLPDSAEETERTQVRQQMLALEKRIVDCWHKLLVRNADYATDALLWQVRSETSHQTLPPDTLLLEYFLVRGRWVVFLVTNHGVQVEYLAVDHAQIERLHRLWQMHIQLLNPQEYQQPPAMMTSACKLLQHCYQQLLLPIQAEVAKYKKLIFVPHGLLHYLPFHAFHNGSTYLIEQHEVSYLPGATFLHYCQMPPPPANRRFYTFGHSHRARLPYAVEEATQIARLMGGEAFVNEAATIGQFRNVARDCYALHLATHGDFRADNALFSGLAFADGWQTTLDIFNLRLQVSLVTLSACQTGRSAIGSGDELLGLMRAFLSAGAASLVLSLWLVEDQATAQLMQLFYQALADGQTKAAALRHAQMTLIQGVNDPQHGKQCYTHPYYWSPFALVGDAGAY